MYMYLGLVLCNDPFKINMFSTMELPAVWEFLLCGGIIAFCLVTDYSPNKQSNARYETYIAPGFTVTAILCK